MERTPADDSGVTTVRHFLSLDDWSRDDLEDLLSLTRVIKRSPQRFNTVLHSRNVGLLFMKSSTRTRISFEVGINQLGGNAVVLSSSELQLGRGETVADTARVLSRYLDAVMARVYAHEMLEELAEAGSIPVINGLSDRLHPCQGLTDFFTIAEHFDERTPAGRKLAYVGDGNNMAHSLLLGGAKLGVHVSVATPEGYEPDAAIVATARERGEESGARIEVVRDPLAAASGADVVYTDVWASMGQEAEQAKRKADFAAYQVRAAVMDAAARDAIFMHCLPAHRGEEVAADVIDSEQSIVFEQAENRLHAQKALLTVIFDATE